MAEANGLLMDDLIEKKWEREKKKIAWSNTGKVRTRQLENMQAFLRLESK